MLFQVINQILRVFDLSITAQVDKTAVSAVAFFNQLSGVFVSFGTGLAIGCSILIAGHIGKGDYEKVKKTVNSSLALSVISGLVLSIILICGADIVLALVNTPSDLTQTGLNYYKCEMAGLVFQYFNNMYIAVERARGNGKMILIINLMLSIIKIALSAFFVLGLDLSIVMVSVSTLISQGIITFIGIYRLRDKNDVFGLAMNYVDLKAKNIGQMLKISLPVIGEKIAFSGGKTMVNSIGAYYGTDIIGALGVSNTMSALATTPPVAIGEGSSTIIRQNLGNSNKKRAWDCFKAVLIINMAFGILAIIGTLISLDFLISVFSTGDENFGILIKEVFMIEVISNIFVTINSAVMGLLYGLGYTKISFVVNFSRLFVFRLPVLLFYRYCTTVSGSTVMGSVMMISNALTGIFAIIIAIIIYKKQFKEKGIEV